MEKQRDPKKIIAEGEATGHAHVAECDTAYVETAGGEVKVLHAPDGTTIGHEEHHAIALPPGDYIVGTVQEFDHTAEEARNVID